MKWQNCYVIGNGKTTGPLLRVGSLPQATIIVNPMRFISLRRAMHVYLMGALRRDVIVLVNIVEEKPIIWRLIRPRITKVVQMRFDKDCSDGCSGTLHRERELKTSGYLKQELVPLDGLLLCAEATSAGNTGLAGILIGVKSALSIEVKGFNFYRGKNANLTYGLGFKNHLRELAEISDSLEEKFVEVVRKNSQVRFTWFRKKSEESTHYHSPHNLLTVHSNN